MEKGKITDLARLFCTDAEQELLFDDRGTSFPVIRHSAKFLSMEQGDVDDVNLPAEDGGFKRLKSDVENSSGVLDECKIDDGAGLPNVEMIGSKRKRRQSWVEQTDSGDVRQEILESLNRDKSGEVSM